MKNKLDPLIIESDELLKKGTLTLAKNIGKITAITVALVAILLTFTDVSLTELGGESFTLSAALLLLASYLMYFSLEDAGEGLGEESEEYIAAIESYENTRDKIQGANAVRLRDFCIRYSVNELEYRRKSYLWRNAVSEEEYKDYLNGKVFEGEKKRIMKRAQRLRAVPISPTDLLTGDRSIGKSELKSPERTKLLRLCTRLIPTTLCNRALEFLLTS